MSKKDAGLPTADDVRGILPRDRAQWCPGCSQNVSEPCHHYHCPAKEKFASAQEPTAWNCVYPTHGRITLRQDEAEAAAADGAVVTPLYPGAPLRTPAASERPIDHEREGRAKAALAYLIDHIVYSDSYGVHGSDFQACHLCMGGGAPGVPMIHDITCPVAKCQAVADEWWTDKEEERKELEAERDQALSQVEEERARPRDFLAWAVDMFGPVAKLHNERLMRFVEEAIELAHADHMERATLDAIADRVYSRPRGDALREIGQAQACLETLAENLGESSTEQAEIEWQRVRSIPREEWARRHAAKQALGIALSDTSTIRQPEETDK